jgi:predicted aconitase
VRDGSNPGLTLTDEEQALLAGERGEAASLAMKVIVGLARVSKAKRLLPISGAHVDSCLYHGPVGLEFAERLASAGGRVAVPTTLNVSALDLIHPDLVQLDPQTRNQAKRLMDAYVAMGCQPSWTCAPYQLPIRPGFGEHIAWAESNAIVFANSVLGARTARYGDFVDICAALTGRVPDAGLHRDENRRARIVLNIDWLDVAGGNGVPDELFGLIGHVVGQEAGVHVPAIVGLPLGTTEDQLKALGAAAASSGSVAMFHAVGVTPEAPTLDAATGGRRPSRVVHVSRERLRRAWDELSTTDGGHGLAAVCVGTPHFSLAQFEQFERLLDGRAVHPDVALYASTGRDNLAHLTATGQAARLEAAGVRLVADTCTYVTPILRTPHGSTVMTDSAKWAWYAPGNLGVEVVYASLADCVASAIEGRVIRRRPPVLHE